MDFSIPHSISILQQIAVVNFPRIIAVHIPIKPYTQVPTIQAIAKDGISALVRKECLLVVVGLVTPLSLRKRSAETVSREHHNALKMLSRAFAGIASLFVETTHCLAEFAPSHFLHSVASFQYYVVVVL